MPATEYANNLVLNKFFRNVGALPSGNRYIGFSTTPIDKDGLGAREPGGGVSNGDYWLDSDAEPTVLNIRTSGVWVVFSSGSVTISKEPPIPTALNEGEYWVDWEEDDIYATLYQCSELEDIGVYDWVNLEAEIYVQADEPGGDTFGYSRLPYSGSNWYTYGTSILANSGTITSASATGRWGTITEIFIADALIGGNILYHYKINPNIPVSAGTKIKINPNTILVSEVMLEEQL